MENRHCVACNKTFQPRPQSPHQSYCSAPNCQRQRKRRWQKNKRQTDSDYQYNQNQAQKAWSKRNPDYWSLYRKSHPEYTERNRSSQKRRNRQANAGSIAKMDASVSVNSLPSGIYQLSHITDDAIVKMDVWIVEISVHDCICTKIEKIAKR